MGERVRTGWEKIGTMATRDGRAVRFGNRTGIVPGDEDTYASYGVPWANVSNTPFRLYKHWVHEGGIATPFIVHWPAGIQARGELRHQPAQLPDVMATFLDVAGVPYPSAYGGRTVQPMEGCSMAPTFAGQPHGREVLYWEHEGNKAVRKGRWKLVCKYPGDWELYDMEAGRTEMADLSGAHPEVVDELAGLYEAWAARCGVISWQELLARRAAHRERDHE
jgi:arylsulfatase